MKECIAPFFVIIVPFPLNANWSEFTCQCCTACVCMDVRVIAWTDTVLCLLSFANPVVSPCR